MWIFKRKKEPTRLEKEMDSLLMTMNYVEHTDEAYTTMVDNLEKLSKIKVSEKPKKEGLNWTAIITGGLIPLLGILLITNHEKTDIITSKAFGWIPKGRG